MADLYYPQLTSGAIAHFPIRKRRTTRTIVNVSPDGTLTMLPDDGAARVAWDWTYAGLSFLDVATLQRFFASCCGPLKPFTFLAPTGNLLANSSDFGSESWVKSTQLRIEPQSSGPFPSVTGTTVTNIGQGAQELRQTLTIPSSYQYCFSAYVSSETPQTILLFRGGSSSEDTTTAHVGLRWKRVWTQGRLVENSNSFSIGVRLAAGQQVLIAAAQLETQLLPSPYRATTQKGEVYQNAHWGMEELQIGCEAPNTFSLDISIESAS